MYCCWINRERLGKTGGGRNEGNWGGLSFLCREMFSRWKLDKHAIGLKTWNRKIGRRSPKTAKIANLHYSQTHNSTKNWCLWPRGGENCFSLWVYDSGLTGLILKNHILLTVLLLNPVVPNRFPGLLTMFLVSGIGFRSVICETEWFGWCFQWFSTVS